MSEPRTHDEFCFNTDLYQDDVEDYMCICNRLDDARRQERTDQQELTKAAVAEAEQRGCQCPPINVDCEHPTCPRGIPEARAKGAADEWARIRQAVEGLAAPISHARLLRASDVLAIIDGSER